MRKNNIELIRIISMLMIVSLHYLSKGGALISLAAPLTVNGYIAWLLEALCLVGVNIFLLISGYFGLSNRNGVTKACKLWTQVWFYSVLIGIIAIITGIQEMDIYTIYSYIFPISTEHYWFATMFIFLCLIAPFLQAGAEKLDQKTFFGLLTGLLIFECFSKSFIPMRLPIDREGYDLIWGICCYLTGMYLRKFGFGNLFATKKRSLILYFVCQIGIYVWTMILQQIYLHTGKLQDFISYSYSYNFILCYIGAIAFFAYFVQSKDITGKTGKAISVLGKSTFGVYLIHEHVNLRYLWPQWFGCNQAMTASLPIFLLHMIITVIIVYTVCTLIELVRQFLFQKVIKKHE